MPTSLVFKFPKDRWHYLFHPAPLPRRKRLSSTLLELVCCEVCIQLSLKRANSKSERTCPSLSVKFKQLTVKVSLHWICTDSVETCLGEVQGGRICLCTALLSEENSAVLPPSNWEVSLQDTNLPCPLGKSIYSKWALPLHYQYLKDSSNTETKLRDFQELFTMQRDEKFSMQSIVNRNEHWLHCSKTPCLLYRMSHKALYFLNNPIPVAVRM